MHFKDLLRRCLFTSKEIKRKRKKTKEYTQVYSVDKDGNKKKIDELLYNHTTNVIFTKNK